EPFMNDQKARRRWDWAGIFRSVRNRTFFPQPPWMDSRRSGKCLPNPTFVHENADRSRIAPASGVRMAERLTRTQGGASERRPRQPDSIGPIERGDVLCWNAAPRRQLQYTQRGLHAPPPNRK